jgi:hypothetical protein
MRCLTPLLRVPYLTESKRPPGCLVVEWDERVSRMGAISTEMVDTGEKRDRRGRRMMPGDRRTQMVPVYHARG